MACRACIDRQGMHGVVFALQGGEAGLRVVSPKTGGNVSTLAVMRLAYTELGKAIDQLAREPAEVPDGHVFDAPLNLPKTRN